LNIRSDSSEREQQDWENDTVARRASFDRKMDDATHRKSLEEKGIQW
jgi:hypothetical protein